MVKRKSIVVGVVMVLCSALNGPVYARPQQDNGVLQAERNLARVRVQVEAGVAGTDDLHQAKIALAEASLKVALGKHQEATVQKNLEIIVQEREAQVRQAEELYRAGVLGVDGVGAVRLHLVQARIRREVYPLVVLRERSLELARVQVKAGVVSHEAVEKAEKALEEARRQFAEAAPPGNGVVLRLEDETSPVGQ